MRRGNIRSEVIPGNPAELERLMSEFLPDFQLRLVGEEPPFELTRIATGELVGPVENLSSGEAEYLTVGLDIVLQSALWNLEERKAPILLIDEPDQHLHPDLQQRFGQLLVQVVDHFEVQVIVATHSTTLLSALGHHGGGKHHPLRDVAEAGGWKDTETLLTYYQQPDRETLLAVVNEPKKVREGGVR